jgi:thiopurine S-methyltransferase
MIDGDRWQARWEEGRIGFHQDVVNEILTQRWPQIVEDSSSTVLVPLCGKSRDMTWLHQQGHSIVGVELTEIACRAFFEEQDFPYVVERIGSHELFVGTGVADGIRIFCGDLFELPVDQVSDVGAWYDRAAIVALPPEVQKLYAAWLTRTLKSGTPGFMLTFDYPRGVRNGAPYPVSLTDVESLFQSNFDVVLLGQVDLGANNRWGLSWVKEPAIQLTRC